jgi:hypothetical protein
MIWITYNKMKNTSADIASADITMMKTCFSEFSSFGIARVHQSEPTAGDCPISGRQD